MTVDNRNILREHELLGEDLYRYLGSESVETRFCFDANASTPLGLNGWRGDEEINLSTKTPYNNCLQH
jgi:hypothetical protein